MGFMMRIVRSLAVLAGAAVVAGAAWLHFKPPELLRVGDGYAAKIVCSNVFIAGRDPKEVLADDVQAPGNPLLRLIRVDVDREQKRVAARILGLFAPNYAMYRGAFGCTTVPDGNFAAAQKALPDEPGVSQAASTASWPTGDDVAATADGSVTALLTRQDLVGPNMRAVVVVHDGRILAEAYGAGFGPNTPLLGWSMTKTVNAAILGTLMSKGSIRLDEAKLLPQWSGDDRAAITLANLLGMESGLRFNENYGAVSDVTRMLYLDPDQTALPAGRSRKYEPGTTFNYSSGTSVLISRIWMDRIGDQRAALDYPRQALFAPLGMSSAVFETDARGTFSGGSYLYATARDWARFGQFILQDGVWNGERLLPEGFVGMMRQGTRSSDGAYSQMQTWVRLPGAADNEAIGIPSDAFWMEGHDGQSIAVVPSAKLVVVRLGLTPRAFNYTPQPLLKEVVAALSGAAG
ncbi:6-aminohexanoate hydrolase [Rhizobium sp. Root708]|uniref:serine hydrolase domain-containing protein n=1 Tax=Rhizobium sp. Root708 TaxID=1736592 RepID=UPI0006F728D7|nr:serine hydrolase [Rhizobium sp. Root708]KRB61422.1 6-aminohexanoate hydrolase [Rhizobium sp. Root708]